MKDKQSELSKDLERMGGINVKRSLPGVEGPCVKCGKDALDTGLECTECGYDNRDWYRSSVSATALQETKDGR